MDNSELHSENAQITPLAQAGNHITNGVSEHVAQQLSEGSDSLSSKQSLNALTQDTATDAAEDLPSEISAVPHHQVAGISSVAERLPSDSKLDHPTPSPSDPLGNGSSDADSTMVDFIDATPGAITDAARPATTGTPIAPAVLQQVTPEPEPLLNGDIAQMHTQASAPGPTLLGTAPNSTATADAPSQAMPIPEPSHHVLEDPTSSTAAVVATIDPAAIPSQAHAIPNPDASTPVATPLPVTAEDVEMMESSTSNLIRPRDDDEMADGPSAKRTKLEDTSIPSTSEAPAIEQPARPEVPLSTSTLPVVPPVANGTATSHLPPRSTYSSQTLTKVQRKILEEKIKNTKKVKSAVPFLRPVDPIALNIPQYTTIITSPMDLGTMENKLRNDQYASIEAFVNDFEMLVNNCFTFNGPAHAVSGMAQNLRAYFLKQMDSVPTGDMSTAVPKHVKKESTFTKPLPKRESRAVSGPGAAVGASTTAPSYPTPVKASAPPQSPTVNDTFALLPGGTPQIRRDSSAGRPKRTVVPPPSRDLPYSNTKPKRKENLIGLKFCEFVLEELRKPKYDSVTVFFRDPVDPVALNIPQYFSIIKQPMDISTVTKNLKNGQFSSAEDFKSDFDLILSNCFRFNPPENGVHMKGKELQSEFEALWRKRGEWVKKNQPRSQRVSPASDVESEGEESDESEQEDGHDEKESTIRALKEQLANMQNMLTGLTGSTKRDSPKASGSKKKNRTSSGAPKSKRASMSAPSLKTSQKPKPAKKARLVSWDEKQEISSATENMSEAQIGRLTTIITENVDKYKNMAGDDVELEIDDLPNDVQHKLLKYVRTIFPPQQREEPEDLAVDDDYEPERGSKAGRKKHKPMKKQEQESRIAQLSAKVEAMKNGGGSAPATAAVESSGDEDSESSEEE